MDNFKNGIASFGIPVLAVPGVSRTGNVYWVDYNGTNASDNTSSGSYDIPFKTLDYAVGMCTANNGDIINIKEGHTETITASNTLAIDVAGLTIVGMGIGADRPTFTVSTDAAATITISGASTKLMNILVIGALDGLNTAVTVSGADCDLDFEYRDTSSTVEADIAVACTGDRLNLKLRDIGFIAGDQRDQSVTLNGVDNARINIDFYGKVGTAVVNFVTGSCKDINVSGTMYLSGTTDGSKDVVDTAGSSTWYAQIYDAAAGCVFAGGSGKAFQKADVVAAISDIALITAGASDLTSAASDLVKIASDLTIVASDLTASSASITTIASDTVSVLEHISDLKSDLTKIDTVVDKISSDVIVILSDTVVIANNTSDIIVATTKIYSDTTANANYCSDIIVATTKLQSDLVLVDTVVDKIYSDTTSIATLSNKISSDLVALMAKYASDVP